jgi:hypothetical protein
MLIEFNQKLVNTLAQKESLLFDEVLQETLAIELKPPIKASEVDYTEFLKFTW